MYRRLIVNVAEHETRVAIQEDGTIVELFVQRKDGSDIAGNIYKGRVQRVLPGMQAAFVNIGLEQAAFLHVNDVIDESCYNFGDYEKAFGLDDAENEAEELKPEAAERLESTADQEKHIEELLREGQEILVHVAKSPIGTKGARVTSHISLPGRYLVLMATSDHIGVSRKIEDEEERNRLKEMVGALREDRIGYIARTASEGIDSAKMSREMKFLSNLRKNILKRYQAATAPALLHKELDVSQRALRDLMTSEAERLIIDSKSAYDTIKKFIETFMPGLKNSIELYEGGEPIFDAYNLEGDISRALQKKVWLKSGGYIVIEQTEALVSIDVNTGRYVGKHNLEETIVKTNLEAVKEIAYQVRLRDIGGLIIIDFIDMEKKSNQDKIYSAFKETLKKDRSKINILPFSEMGLIQMTRKRVKKSLTSLLCEPCFYCDGAGYQISRRTICFNIFREVLRAAQDMTGERFTLRVNPKIADYLHDEEKRVIILLEQITGKPVIIYPHKEFYREEFDIFENQA
jgi:ribonuclease G